MVLALWGFEGEIDVRTFLAGLVWLGGFKMR